MFEELTFMHYFKQYMHDHKVYSTIKILAKMILVLLFMKTNN